MKDNEEMNEFDMSIGTRKEWEEGFRRFASKNGRSYKVIFGGMGYFAEQKEKRERMNESRNSRNRTEEA